MPAETPNVFTFPRNEPGTMGHLDLVEPLRSLPGDLREALTGISEQELAYRPAEDAWCIREIVGHLRDCVEVDHQRLYMMSTQTDPILEPFDQDAFAREHGYMKRPVEEMLRELEVIREKTINLLTSLVNWNWARTGQHRETGRTSIRQYVEYLVEHEGQHLTDVRALRASAVG